MRDYVLNLDANYAADLGTIRNGLALGARNFNFYYKIKVVHPWEAAITVLLDRGSLYIVGFKHHECAFYLQETEVEADDEPPPSKGKGPKGKGGPAPKSAPKGASPTTVWQEPKVATRGLEFDGHYKTLGCFPSGGKGIVISMSTLFDSISKLRGLSKESVLEDGEKIAIANLVFAVSEALRFASVEALVTQLCNGQIQEFNSTTIETTVKNWKKMTKAANPDIRLPWTPKPA